MIVEVIGALIGSAIVRATHDRDESETDAYQAGSTSGIGSTSNDNVDSVEPSSERQTTLDEFGF